MAESKCPCGSDQGIEVCCGLYLSGDQQAPTPEALMRSRYTAFTAKNLQYLFETTDPQARMEFNFESNRKWAEESQFTKLEIIAHSMDGNKGMVEFKAYFLENQPEGPAIPQIHHELSKFRKQAGVWFFRDGRVVKPTKS
jgi:SEC-C motif-containing protein